MSNHDHDNGAGRDPLADMMDQSAPKRKRRRSDPAARIRDVARVIMALPSVCDGPEGLPHLIRLARAVGMTDTERLGAAHLEGNGRALVRDHAETLLSALEAEAAAPAPAAAVRRGAALDSALVCPARRSDYIVTPPVRMAWALADHRRGGAEEAHVLLIGPPGTGKTEGWLQYAADRGLRALVVDVSVYREPSDLYGRWVLEANPGGGTVTRWQESAFAAALVQGNVLVILDELSRCQPLVGNALLPLLDGRGRVWVDEMQEPIIVGPSVTVVATANQASPRDRDIRGIPEALGERFGHRLDVGYLSPGDEASLLRARCGLSEAEADAVAMWANDVRRMAAAGEVSAAPSTRMVIKLCAARAAAAAAGLIRPWAAAMETVAWAWSSHGDADGERGQVRLALLSRLPEGAE